MTLEILIKEYRANPTDEAYQKIDGACVLLTSKSMVDTKGLEKALEDAQKVKDGMEILNLKKN